MELPRSADLRSQYGLCRDGNNTAIFVAPVLCINGRLYTNGDAPLIISKKSMKKGTYSQTEIKKTEMQH